jgi:asparagine synthase (glutamine-hydrolysing)
MSGIFGVFDTLKRSVRNSASAITDRLCQAPTQQAQVYCSPADSEALGRISIGVYNAAPQPVWNDGGTVAIVFAGRLIRDDANTHQSDEQWILECYQRYGIATPASLRGVFSLAIYDSIERRVLVAADRLGLYPIYYAHPAGRFMFAPTQNALLCDQLVSASLDYAGMAQYMRFQQLVGDTTFFAAITYLRGGHQVVYDIDSDTVQEVVYWRFDPDSQIRSDLSFEDAADETARLLIQSVRRSTEGAQRLGVFLSGGLDSRLIVAALGQLGQRPTALTYGLSTSRDAYYAKQVAECADLAHHTSFQENGRWVEEYWRKHLYLTDGSHTWIHMHGIYALDLAHQLMDVNLSGFLGDNLVGGEALREHRFTEKNDELSYAAKMYEWLTTVENWPGMTEWEEQLLYAPGTYAQVNGLAFESLRKALQPDLAYREPLRTDLFEVLTVDMRHYSHYMGFKRSAVEMALPFVDPDLMEFVLTLPVDYRKKRRLSRAVLRRLSTPLAQIPYDKDEHLPTDNSLLRMSHSFVNRARRRLVQLLGVQSPQRHTLHSDYEAWLRTDLRAWGESILFDQRTLERGIFDPEGIRWLWERHLSGTELWTIGKLAPIMSYELMLREFAGAASSG